MTRLSHADMADEMAKLVYSKRQLILNHASKRPAQWVTDRSRELEVLEQAEADYRRAAERQRGEVCSD